MQLDDTIPLTTQEYEVCHPHRMLSSHLLHTPPTYAHARLLHSTRSSAGCSICQPFQHLIVQEWGNPNEKEYYEYMKSYSPLDNVTSQVHSLALQNFEITLHGWWASQAYSV